MRGPFCDPLHRSAISTLISCANACGLVCAFVPLYIPPLKVDFGASIFSSGNVRGAFYCAFGACRVNCKTRRVPPFEELSLLPKDCPYFHLNYFLWERLLERLWCLPRRAISDLLSQSLIVGVCYFLCPFRPSLRWDLLTAFSIPSFSCFLASLFFTLPSPPLLF